MKNIGNRYDWQAMVIVTVLMLIGIGILWGTGLFTVTSLETFAEWFMQFGMALIFCGFFIGVGLYCWVLYFRNVVAKPKERTLYLKEKEDNICTFVDKKGNIFYFEDNNYIIGHYYLVLKTRDHIHKIKGESMDNFEIKTRISYWLNFYTPMGDFENLFLLPILYIIMLPFIFMISSPDIVIRIIGSIMFAPCALILLYDLKEKIRRSKN